MRAVRPRGGRAHSFSPGRSLNRINTLTLAGLLLGAGCVLSSAQPSARQLESARGFAWVVDTVDHFVLHIEQGSIAERRADLLAFQLDRARERALHLLDFPESFERIDVFVVASRNRMD